MRILKTLPILVAFISLFSIAQQPPVAAVPHDPYEIVTGPAQVLDTGAKRADILSALERARQNANLHAPGSASFRIHLTIDATGYGYAQMEEDWVSGRKWRWTASLGNISETRIGTNGAVYEAGPGLPLRLQTLRSAIFWPVTIGPQGLLRIASGNLNGTELLCILHSPGMPPNEAPAGRRWEETEYCIDTQSGLLRVYSQAPGIYVVFDYDQAVHFHDRVLPRRLALYEAGKKMIDARIDSLDDLTAADSQLFTPTQEMLSRGRVATAGGPLRFPQPAPVPANVALTAIQPVIVHASIAPDGHVLEAEALQNYGTLSEAAVGIVRAATYPAATMGGSHQREAFINVRFGAIQQTAKKDSGPQGQ